MTYIWDLSCAMAESPQVTDHALSGFGLICNWAVDFQEQIPKEMKVEPMAHEDLTLYVIVCAILVGPSCGRQESGKIFRRTRSWEISLQSV